MKLALTDTIVQKLSLDNAPVQGEKGVEWRKTDKPNYLVYDSNRLAPPGFAVTVRERAGIKMVRGHDLRRTFGAACEKLGLADRQVKRMLGHSVGGGETLGRYTAPEWKDHMERMVKIEQLILKSAPALHNALRPAKVADLPEKGETVIKPGPLARKTRSRRG